MDRPDPIPSILGTLESALYAADLEAARYFYHGVIGLAIVGHVPGRHVFFRVGGSVLLVFNPEATERPAVPGARLAVPAHGARGPGHYCFSATPADLDLWRAHLVVRGVAIEAEVAWPNGARSFYVRDPAGNSVEFAEPGLWD